MCRQAESVAREMGLEEEKHNLDSRAAMAMVDVLLEAGRQGGHSYLKWDQLQARALAHLNAGGRLAYIYPHNGIKWLKLSTSCAKFPSKGVWLTRETWRLILALTLWDFLSRMHFGSENGKNVDSKWLVVFRLLCI